MSAHAGLALGWRCLRCGVLHAAHGTVCSSCWSHGVIVRRTFRPPAALDVEPARWTAADVAKVRIQRVPSRNYPSIEVGRGAVKVLYGVAGGGKSSMAVRYVDGLDGDALVVSAEEALGPALQARLQRCGVSRPGVAFMRGGTVDNVVEELRRTKAVALVIDSLQAGGWTARDLRRVLEVVPSCGVVVAVAQVNKRGVPAGHNDVLHEADIVVAVEAMRWTVEKSRYQQVGLTGDVLPTATKELSA